MFGSASILAFRRLVDRQRYVLFVTATATDRPGVFTPMAGVKRDRDQSIDDRLALA